MPQVTPFRGTNLTDLVIDRRDFNESQRRFDAQTALQGRRIGLSEQQLDIAAEQMGLRRDEFLNQAFKETIETSENADEAIARLNLIKPIAPEVEQMLRQQAPEAFGRALRMRTLEEDKLRLQGQKVLSPGQVLVDREGNVIASGGEKPPTPSEQLKIDAAEKSEERKEANQQDIQDVARTLLANPALERVFGTLQSRFPTLTQEVADAEADVDRLVAMLSLDAREALKGTGQISDFESKQLGAAATVLSNKRISDDKAKEALATIAGILLGDAERTNAKGEVVGRFTVRSK